MLEVKSDFFSKNAQKIQEALRCKNVDFKVVELPSSTRTAQEAAETIGCTVAQIVKSLVFYTQNFRKPILLLVSGVNRVHEKNIETQIGEKISKADALFVKETTGFAIGGVPPIGHKQPLLTLIDEDLLQLGNLWAAAGTPNAVFSLKSNDLVPLTGGTVIQVKQDSRQ